MQRRASNGRVLVLGALLVAWSCGGKASSGQPDGGNGGAPVDGGAVQSSNDSGSSARPAGSSGAPSGGVGGGSSGAAVGPSSGSPGAGSGDTGMPFGGPEGSAGSSAGDTSSGAATQTCDAGAPPPPPTSACGSCVWKGCASEVSACEADCSCSPMLAQAQSCVESGSPSPFCFSGMNGGAASALAFCFAQTTGECPCSTSSDDGGGACVPSLSSGGSGGGSCSATADETCNGTTYQVICTCPEAECACFGPTSRVIAFDGCPYCPTISLPLGDGGSPQLNALFKQCGFPAP